jgi:(2Fe-2S) ferredoxin
VARRRFKIVICRGPECGDCRGSAELAPAFQAALERHVGAGPTGLAEVELEWQSCFGRCSQGPNVLVRELIPPPAGGPRLGTGFATVPGPRGATALYNGVDAEKAERIVTEHVVGGRIIRELIELPKVALPSTPGETPP